MVAAVEEMFCGNDFLDGAQFWRLLFVLEEFRQRVSPARPHD
jgi:hypothetical protein